MGMDHARKRSRLLQVVSTYPRKKEVCQMNMYQRCEECRGYINTMTTDHMKVEGVDGATVHLHMRPCYQRYAESNEHKVIDRVLTRYRHKLVWS